MLATENARDLAPLSPECTPAPIAELVGLAKWPRPCSRRNICRSLLCRTSRADMTRLGSRKGD